VEDAEQGLSTVLEAEAAQFEEEARRIAAGGWQRAAIGFLMGVAAGLLAALVMPRDEGPRRSVRPADRPDPFDDDAVTR
jgi:hypothetical protein